MAYSETSRRQAKVRTVIAWAVSMLIAFPAPLLGEDLETLVPESSSISEVRLIQADSMALTQRPGEPQVLRGNVEIVIVDREKRESRIRAAKISIFTSEKPRRFERVVAEGRVIMEREGMTAKSELAVYDGRQGTVDLLEDNYIHDARGELTADRIRVNLNTNQVAAEGNVRGVIYPREFKSSDNER